MEQLREPDFGKLKEACERYAKDASRTGRVDSAGSYDVFRAAMEALYGKDVWTRLKAQREKSK